MERRFPISEVSKLVGVQAHVLRQWESRIPQLKPRRDRAGRRYYLEADIEVARRIKHLMWHEKMTTEGVRLQLTQEIRGEGRPKTSTEALDLLDTIESEVRTMLDALGNNPASTVGA